ncbi:Pectate lyase [Heracleum sosnowskyi]|uniref:Pectate lyase n=1 Tax=Heracleum sosnowskyi TaxID=360622 RepID=A0AAD8J291_9APIA|nr:Pectate lyase [Heracleum sosnowskyi]
MDRFLFLILFLLFAPSLLISARSIRLNPDPQSGINSTAVVNDQLQRRTLSNPTGNPIFECWKCDPNWVNDRQHLADCARGFGKGAIGGKLGQIYEVIDPSDKYLINPKPGTLRYALIQSKPLWITFSGSMRIKLSGQLYVGSFKTIDGRGADVCISGIGCLLLEDVTNVIIHGVGISSCASADSAYIKMNETLVKHAGKAKGNGITIIRSHNIWVDNCTISDCAYNLIDATLFNTGLTFSNNLYLNKSELLLDRQDNNGLKQVTTVYNRFGEDLTKIPPSRNNGGSGSNTSGSGGKVSNGQNGDGGKNNNFWYGVKHNNALRVMVLGFGMTIALGGVGYGIHRMHDCGNGNSCFNCCNGNRNN